METTADSLFAEKAARIKDLFLGTVFVFTGLGSYRLISQAGETGLIVNQEVDYSTLPKIWGVALVMLTVLWMLRSALELLQCNRDIKKHDFRNRQITLQGLFPDLTRTVSLRIILSVAALLIYGTLLETVLFGLLTAAFLFIMLLTFGRPINKITIALSVGGGTFFHLFFITMLNLPLY